MKKEIPVGDALNRNKELIMTRNHGWLGLRLFSMLVGVMGIAAGCSIGPKALEANRTRYNEAIKSTTDEQLLLNIVRLRYLDSPTSLSVSNIAAQFELQKNLSAVPFTTSAASAEVIQAFRDVLPGASLMGADRPTLSLTPQDDQEFTRRLFTPLALEGIVYLGKTTWPVSVVFRLYLESMNRVPNAQTMSGPTSAEAPEYAEFLRGVIILQHFQDHNQVHFFTQDEVEELSAPVKISKITPRLAMDAAKLGYEYRNEDDGKTCKLIKKTPKAVLRFHPETLNTPEGMEFVKIFHLKPGVTTFKLEDEKLDPFPVTYSPQGVTVLDLEPRSLIQVMYYLSTGVCVPQEHFNCHLARQTLHADGTPFDYNELMGGLFTIHSCKQHCRPKNAFVAVRYLDYWYFIDNGDLDTKTTFAFLVALSHMELSGTKSNGPLLTLPVGR